MVKAAGQRYIAIPGTSPGPHRRSIVSQTVDEFGRLDVLVNNAAFQNPVERPEDLTPQQWQRTFAVNIEANFFLTQAALEHMREGSAIINTASVTGLRGHATLLDYAATRCDHLLDVFVGTSAGGPAHPRERCGAGSGLDAVDPSDHGQDR